MARIVVVGGGLAGMVGAVTAARRGADVVLLEARGSVGGRARTTCADGYLLNQGPHALYATGAGIRVLRDLGLSPRGSRPPAEGGFGRLRGRIALLPGTPAAALRSRLIGLRAKAQLARLLARPAAALRTEMSGRSMRQWIDEQVTHADARALVEMTFRLTTYVDDPATIAAEAAVPQLVAALTDGVLYLDGGWQQLVDDLRVLAVDAGVKIETDTKVESIGDVGDADAFVLAAGGPAHAARLVGDASAVVHRWAAAARPVYGACLDLALRRLPRPERRVCMGDDDPIYCSAHTPTAALAPDGGEVVHVMRYGDPGDDPRTELEAFLDDAQPGWRDEVVTHRYGRHMLVSHDRPAPGVGLDGRPGPAIDDLGNVFVAGDWVGPVGLLADASLVSGHAAAVAAASSCLTTP